MKTIKAIFASFSSSFRNFTYPSLCRCCQQSIFHKNYLCQLCLELLDIVSVDERCPFCFSLSSDVLNKPCFRCRKQEPVFDGLAAAFEYEGPASSLIRQLKYGNEPYLAKGMGAFLALQFFRLNWPLPDAIVPMPISFAHRFERGYNQSELLSESLMKILNVPVLPLLKRKSGDYSQAGLSYLQRQQLDSSSFFLSKQSLLRDKTILLIDDVMTTGKTLNNAARVLREGIPKKLYGLTFCFTKE